jgi:hypothetical protein
METTGCEEQALAVAERAKGDVTAAPLAGLATVTEAKTVVEHAVQRTREGARRRRAFMGACHSF